MSDLLMFEKSFEGIDIFENSFIFGLCFDDKFPDEVEQYRVTTPDTRTH